MKKWYFLSPLFLQKFIWIPTRIILSGLGRMEIIGLDNLRSVKSNAIFACNHSSEFDVFMVPGSLPFFSRFSPTFYTSRERSFYSNSGWRQHFYGGVFFKAWGAYPVCVGLHDYDKSLVNHIDIIKSGGNLVMFPEGGTTKDGNFKPAKGGIIHLAAVTGRPIVPVYIGGTFRMNSAGFWKGHRRISISFGEPIYVPLKAGVVPSPDECKIQAQAVMDRMRSMKQKVTVIQPVPVPVSAGIRA